MVLFPFWSSYHACHEGEPLQLIVGVGYSSLEPMQIALKARQEVSLDAWQGGRRETYSVAGRALETRL